MPSHLLPCREWRSWALSTVKLSVYRSSLAVTMQQRFIPNISIRPTTPQVSQLHLGNHWDLFLNLDASLARHRKLRGKGFTLLLTSYWLGAHRVEGYEKISAWWNLHFTRRSRVFLPAALSSLCRRLFLHGNYFERLFHSLIYRYYSSPPGLLLPPTITVISVNARREITAAVVF